MKIAIMQPYFIPYAGYFRLFCASDLFVIYDCVQFLRRGWVHRNKLKVHSGELDWLTLPLEKQPIDTPIKDLFFRTGAQAEWENTFARFPGLKIIANKYPKLYAALINFGLTTTSAYIVNVLREICDILAIPFNIAYSASLNIPANVKGQERILHIAKHYQAGDYINASGGRELYTSEAFTKQGISLHFLPDYQGDFQSILQCLAEREPEVIRENLYAQLV